jgi:predicted patatin/cPLA2 family phospholipase
MLVLKYKIGEESLKNPSVHTGGKNIGIDVIRDLNELVREVNPSKNSYAHEVMKFKSMDPSYAQALIRSPNSISNIEKNKTAIRNGLGNLINDSDLEVLSRLKAGGFNFKGH